jgi:phosphatidylglycerol:prolipoprotein diacylglycerol transferase
MINPIIFSFHIGSVEFALRWYGVLAMTGMIVGAWLAEREIRRRGEDGEHLWSAMIWLVIAGVVGARAWYVLQSILTGSRYYLDNPLEIVKIWAGGLHFFGGLLFGAIALLFYIRKYKLDVWLFLDSIAPMTLIGQAIARPANFINQELYGPATTLPWGIPIDAFHRLPPYNDLLTYPEETTRFHPTFAYEMIWNFVTAGTLLWLARRFPEKFKPGAVFGWWLVIAGVGRTLIEGFRFEQPYIPGTAFSYSRLFSVLMALAGTLFLLVRYNVIKLPFAQNWRTSYFKGLPPPTDEKKPA